MRRSTARSAGLSPDEEDNLLGEIYKRIGTLYDRADSIEHSKPGSRPHSARSSAEPTPEPSFSGGHAGAPSSTREPASTARAASEGQVRERRRKAEPRPQSAVLAVLQGRQPSSLARDSTAHGSAHSSPGDNQRQQLVDALGEAEHMISTLRAQLDETNKKLQLASALWINDSHRVGVHSAWHHRCKVSQQSVDY